MTLRSGVRCLLVGAATLALAILLLPIGPSRADPSPFDSLLGSWGGTGEIRLDKGRRERIKCNAYYTGGGSQLGLAIRCNSDSYKIEIRSKLSYSGGRLSGNWEERTFNATGSASGTATPSRIALSITGWRLRNHGRQLHQIPSKRVDLNPGYCLARREHHAWPQLSLAPAAMAAGRAPGCVRNLALPPG